MNERIETWHLVGVAAVFLSVSLYAAGLQVAESRLRDDLRSVAGSLDWGRVVVTWSGDALVHDLRGARVPGVAFEVERLAVSPDVWAALEGRIRPQTVALTEPDVRLDASAVGGSSRENGGGANREARHGAGLRDRLRGLFEELDRLTVRRADVTVRAGGRDIGRLRGSLRMSRSPGRREGRLDGSGRLSVPASGSALETRWTASGHWRPAEPSVSTSIEFQFDRKRGARPAAGPRVRVEAGELQMSAGRRPGIRATLRQLSARGPSGLDAKMRALEVRWAPGDNLRIDARGVESAIPVGSPLTAILGGAKHSPGSTAVSGVDGAVDSSTGWLLALSRRAEMTIHGGALRILRRSEGDRSADARRQLVELEDLRARIAGRTVEAAARVAGGRVWARARRRVGRWSPAAARLEVRGVHVRSSTDRDGDRPAVERGARATVGGRLDASAALVPRSGVATLGETVDGAVDVRWRNGWIESKALARRRVVGIDASLRADVTWERRLRRIRLTSGRVGYGPVDADLRASVTDWRTDPRLELRLRADRFECQPAVRALPDALLGPYRKIELAGEARPRFTMEFPVEAPDELSIDLDFFPGECRVTALNALESGWPTIEVEPRRDGRVPAPLPGSTSRGAAGTSDARTAESCGANACCHGRPCAPIPGDWSAQRPDDVFWLRKPFVLEMAVDARGEQTVRVGPGLDSFVPLARLPEYVPAAAYLSEEVDFYEDGAWNVGLIQRALRMNFEDHRFVYGGSTVTQQLVKNLFLTRRKTLARKVREALIAWRIQSVVPKDRVLELYLNCIQFGRKVYGIGPAARHYFDKSATELGLKEALFLAAIKPAPWYGDRFMERGSTPEQGWWPDRMREIAGRLVDEGIVSKERVERAAPFVLTWED